MIDIRCVSVVYPNKVKALYGVSSIIEKGEFVFLTGPTGAGKSTLLKLICRDLKPSQGEVWIDGVNVAKIKPNRVPYLRRKLGVVFEDFKLLDGRTVAQNVSYALEVVGATTKEIQKKVSRVLDLVGLSHKANELVERLSGGEQQRTAIARAIINGPSILLADEPTGHLDAETGWEIMQIFSRIHQDGTTVIVATHNLGWIEQLGKRVIFLFDGENIEKYEKGKPRVGFPNTSILST